MKKQATSIVEDVTKKKIQGYTLKTFDTDEGLVEEVARVFGICSYNDRITLINFTREKDTNVSYINLATFY